MRLIVQSGIAQGLKVEDEMTTIDRATQLSDATSSGSRTSERLRLTSRSAGHLGVLARLVLYSIATDAEESHADERRLRTPQRRASRPSR